MPRFREVKPDQLLPGDIIITFSEEQPKKTTHFSEFASHSLLWVSESTIFSKPIVHSMYGSRHFPFSGVLQQSSGCLKTLGMAVVFRYKQNDVAATAAEYARRWAVVSGDPLTAYSRNKHGIAEKKSKRTVPKRFQNEIPLKTPFGHEILGKQLEYDDFNKSWGTDAIAKAYQAYWRAESRQPLSMNKGVTCSQLIICCFQAAMIKHGLIAKLLARELNHSASVVSRRTSFSLKNPESETHLYSVLKYDAQIETAISPPWRLYAKRVHLSDMIRSLLNESGSSFLGELKIR